MRFKNVWYLTQKWIENLRNFFYYVNSVVLQEKTHWAIKVGVTVCLLSFDLLCHSDITLRYKETRQRKHEVPTDRDRPLGNGSTATPSGRSKLNGSSETLRQRKSWRWWWWGTRVVTRSASSSWGVKFKVWCEKWRRIMTQRHKWTRMCYVDLICAYTLSSHSAGAREGAIFIWCIV